MIRFPIFTHLTVTGFGLFPGDPAGAGIRWPFASGLSLIAGVNGLGKTTLLTILLRLLTGPYDLSGEGAPDRLDAVLPAEPVGLNARSLRFFGQRVADGAVGASARLTAMFGSDSLAVERRLDDLSLIALEVNEVSQELPGRKTDREAAFQAQLCELFGLSSFIDVLLILHHVVFFKENRPGALWDENAQRQILRALFLEKTVAAQVADFERRVQSADSRARNISARAYNIEKELAEAKRREAISPKVQAQLAVEQRLLDADLERRQILEQQLDDLDQARKAARLDHEKAKLEREEAESAVERLKYTALLRLFPKMEDAGRLVILRILTKEECLVCGADATKRRKELEALLEKGCCPACGSEPAQQTQVVAPHEVEEARVERARTRADLAKTEEETTRRRLVDLVSEYEGALASIKDIRQAIEERRVKETRLRADLPQASTAVTDLQRTLETTKRSQREAEAERATATQDLRALLEAGQAGIVMQSERLSSQFGTQIGTLLAETATLVRVEGSAKLTQGRTDFSVPAFVPEMTAANRPGLTRRISPSDVSESQRELMDLAFRLALIDASTAGGSCTLVMETPEASLDELAMARVGMALCAFARQGENRLVVTSNLTNAGMITSMFGGAAKSAAEKKRRQSKVLNLLKVAAPNRAVERDGSKYAEILSAAISGPTS
jgi:hypothetical protein